MRQRWVLLHVFAPALKTLTTAVPPIKVRPQIGSRPPNADPTDIHTGHKRPAGGFTARTWPRAENLKSPDPEGHKTQREHRNSLRREALDAVRRMVRHSPRNLLLSCSVQISVNTLWTERICNRSLPQGCCPRQQPIHTERDQEKTSVTPPGRAHWLCVYSSIYQVPGLYGA